MQNKSNLSFENDSNLRGIKTSEVTRQKPDSFFLGEVNKISCNDSDILVQDNSNNSYQKDNFYCFNNGSTKKLVEWKKVDELWLPRNLTNTSEYKEIEGKVCKVITENCDAYNPTNDCMLKCFNNDKTTVTYKADYLNNLIQKK